MVVVSELRVQRGLAHGGGHEDKAESGGRECGECWRASEEDLKEEDRKDRKERHTTQASSGV